MPSTKNQEKYAAIKEDLSKIQAMWVVDYRGLTVKESEALRRSIREADAVMKVYKNSLVELALKELDMPSMGVFQLVLLLLYLLTVIRQQALKH